MDVRTRLGWIRLYEELGHAGVVCRRCGISRPTLRKWWRRYLAEGERGLDDRSRRPHTSPNRKVGPQEVALILALRRERRLGVKRLRIELIREHALKLALDTIHKVLVRHGERFLKRRPFRRKGTKRYSRPVPGDRVQVDVCKIAPSVYQYTAIDDCSRFQVLAVHPRRNAKATLAFLEQVQEEMPFPIQSIETDRGQEFFAYEVQDQRRARQIKFRPIRPRSPHLNGKVERAQRTALDEFWPTIDLASGEIPDQRALWRHHYNASSQRTSRYTVEGNRFSWFGAGPAGALTPVRARIRSSRAARPSRSVRRKSHGPSLSGWIAAMSPRCAARRRVFAVTPTTEAARVRLSQGSNAVLGRAIDGDPVAAAHRSHALASPAIAVAGHEAVAVEDDGDDIVLGDERQHAHRLDDVGGRAVALPPAPSRQSVLGVGAAHPVDGEHDLRGSLVEIGDDLLDHGAHDPLLQPGVGGRGGPHGRQIFGESVEGHGRDGGTRCGGDVMVGDPTQGLGDAFECPVPSRLEFTGDQAVLRIGSIVLAEGAISGVLRRLEVANQRGAGLTLAHHRLRLGVASRLDRGRLHDGEQRRLHEVVDAQAAERDAGRLTIVQAP
jgi:transposase InsO family protein